MMRYAIAYAMSLVIFLTCDFIWISSTLKPLYKANLGKLLRDKPDFGAAGLFYIFYAAAIVYFAVYPNAQPHNDIWRTLINGVALGLVAYGTYDLTNQSTLQGWSLTVTIADMIWGGFATGLAALLVRLAMNRLGY